MRRVTPRYIENARPRCRGSSALPSGDASQLQSLPADGRHDSARHEPAQAGGIPRAGRKPGSTHLSPARCGQPSHRCQAGFCRRFGACDVEAPRRSRACARDQGLSSASRACLGFRIGTRGPAHEPAFAGRGLYCTLNPGLAPWAILCRPPARASAGRFALAIYGEGRASL